MRIDERRLNRISLERTGVNYWNMWRSTYQKKTRISIFPIWIILFDASLNQISSLKILVCTVVFYCKRNIF